MDKRKIAGAFLFAILLLCAIAMIKYKDTIFMSRATIKYPDGCQENYTNKNLTTPECTEGRRLQKEQEEYWDKKMRGDFIINGSFQ
jgi:hypothetical protein